MTLNSVSAASKTQPIFDAQPPKPTFDYLCFLILNKIIPISAGNLSIFVHEYLRVMGPSLVSFIPRRLKDRLQKYVITMRNTYTHVTPIYSWVPSNYA